MNENRTINPVKVALIDSGINNLLLNQKCNIKKRINYKIDDRATIHVDHDLLIRHMHGTAIASTIMCICNNIEFIDINIFDETLSTDGRVLLKALEHAVLEKPDIIHLSLGTTSKRYNSSFRKIMKQASYSNIIIVSAANMEDVKCYPAFLDGVIGVKASKTNDVKSFYYMDKFFFAPSKLHNLLIKSENNLVNLEGTSISAAHITGNIALINSIYGKLSVDETINRLKNKFDIDPSANKMNTCKHL